MSFIGRQDEPRAMGIGCGVSVSNISRQVGQARAGMALSPGHRPKLHHHHCMENEGCPRQCVGRNEHGGPRFDGSGGGGGGEVGWGERPSWVYLLPMHLSISSSGISWLMLILRRILPVCTVQNPHFSQVSVLPPRPRLQCLYEVMPGCPPAYIVWVCGRLYGRSAS